MRAARWLRYETTAALRWMPAVALAALMVLVPVGAAQAASARAAPTISIPGLCGGKESPAPARPDSGAVAWFTHTPDPLPPQADPFAQHPSTTIYEQYGLAGMTFHTYDLGCGGSISNAPAEASSAVANWILGFPKIIFALTAAISSATLKPTWLGVFDKPLTAVTGILQRAIFSPFGPFLLIIAAATIVWGAVRMRIGKALFALGMTLIAITLVAIAVNYPVRAGSIADRTVTGAISGINSQVNGVDPGANPNADPAVRNMSALYSTILYKQWLAGELGSSDSKTATKYGPDLLRASALTWSEAHTMDVDESAGKRIIEDKANLWESTANAIKDSDPDAYEYLKGTRDQGIDRVVSAGLAGITSMLLLPFLMFSFLLMLACFIVIRLLVMLLPLIGAAALLPQMYGVLRTTGEIAAAAIINTIVFAAGTAVVTVASGGILSSNGVPPWLGVVLVSILCFAMWIILRPFRRLTRLAVGRDPLRDMADTGPSVMTKIKHLAGMAAASAIGNFAADEIQDHRERPESFTRPDALPAPPAPTQTPLPAHMGITSGHYYEMPGAAGGTAAGGAASPEPVVLTVVQPPAPPATTYAPMVSADGGRFTPPALASGAHRAITAEPEPAAIEAAPSYTPSTGMRPAVDPVVVDDGATLPAPVEKGYDESGEAVWVIYSPEAGFTAVPAEAEVEGQAGA